MRFQKGWIIYKKYIHISNNITYKYSHNSKKKNPKLFINFKMHMCKTLWRTLKSVLKKQEEKMVGDVKIHKAINAIQIINIFNEISNKISMWFLLSTLHIYSKIHLDMQTPNISQWKALNYVSIEDAYFFKLSKWKQ